jgi:hypothetical protein
MAPTSGPPVDLVRPQTWVDDGRFGRQAHCDCTWVGPRRLLLRTLACTDGLLHAARTGYVPAVTLRRSTAIFPAT